MIIYSAYFYLNVILFYSIFCIFKIVEFIITFLLLILIFHFCKVDLQNTPFTIQFRSGVGNHLANTIIDTKNVRVAIKFGSLNFPTIADVTFEAPLCGASI